MRADGWVALVAQIKGVSEETDSVEWLNEERVG